MLIGPQWIQKWIQEAFNLTKTVRRKVQLLLAKTHQEVFHFQNKLSRYKICHRNSSHLLICWERIINRINLIQSIKHQRLKIWIPLNYLKSITLTIRNTVQIKWVQVKSTCNRIGSVICLKIGMITVYQHLTRLAYNRWETVYIKLTNKEATYLTSQVTPKDTCRAA